MGRREIASNALIAVFGLGGTAFVSGLVAPASTATPFLIWGGLLAMTMAGGLLVRQAVAAKPAIVGEVPGEPQREFLPPEITVAVLRDKVDGRTSVQIDALTRTYKDKWLRYEGIVRDVSNVYSGRYLLMLADKPGDYDLIGVAFDKSWREQLSALNKGDWVTVEGKVSRLQSGVSLEDGVIVHIGKTPSAPKKPRAPRKKAPSAADS